MCQIKFVIILTVIYIGLSKNNFIFSDTSVLQKYFK